MPAVRLMSKIAWKTSIPHASARLENDLCSGEPNNLHEVLPGGAQFPGLVRRTFEPESSHWFGLGPKDTHQQA